MLTAVLAAPVAAFTPISSTGLSGDYGWPDSPDAQGRCGYTDRLPPDNYAHLKWIKVAAPLIAARNLTPGVADYQQASWQVKIQRQANGQPWKTVATSPQQKMQTSDQGSAPYTAMKVRLKQKGGYGEAYRAIVILRWFRNGSVEGTVKVSIDEYSVNWTSGDPNYIFSGWCSGEAD
jgi:hypothetical protein